MKETFHVVFIFSSEDNQPLHLPTYYCLFHVGCTVEMYFKFHLTLHPAENNKPPVADAGPEKELTLPVDRTTLDGSKSSDDQKIATYHWKQTK